jgi:hypothetical protein
VKSAVLLDNITLVHLALARRTQKSRVCQDEAANGRCEDGDAVCFADEGVQGKVLFVPYAAVAVWNRIRALRPPSAPEDSRTIEAPCRMAISFAIARPRPLPVTTVSRRR